MSYNGSGTFQINTTGQPVVTGTVISSTAFNALTADLATGLSTAITKDGQTATTARIPFAAGISSTLVTDSTSSSTGSIITSGGIGVAKAAYIGTTLTVTGSSTFTGAIAVDSVTDSSSTLTGSIQTDGGLGVAKAVFVGTTLSVSGTSTLTGVATLTAQPILSSLTASKPVFTDASKGLVSTGTLAADQGGTGVANNAAMTVTGSGNFAYTRTLTGTTNVTFPTTGTLATLAGSETFTNKTLISPAIGGTPTGVGVLTSGTAVASTSGTSIDFTSIPSWVKRITVMFNGVSTSGTSNLQVQIGAGSVVSSGYSSSSWTSNTNNSSATSGFLITATNAAANTYYGNVIICLQTGNTWVESHALGGLTNNNCMGGGSISLGGALDRVRITTVNGTDTFDAGSINILYE
jgi:hypothetical protein